MNSAEFVFLAIDIIFHPLQNYIKIKGIEHIKDQSYDDRYPNCKYDILYKKSTEKLPVLINFHGGGFVKGDKKHRRSLSEMYADNGWFVINANYRLYPKYHFPAQPQDIATLFGILPELAEKYNLDLSRLVVTGDSSGAYMSSYAVAMANDDELCAKIGVEPFKTKPTAFIGYCGPYYLPDMLKFPNILGVITSLTKSITGCTFKDVSDISSFQLYNEISPANFVNEKWCPTCLTYSDQDIFCKGQGPILMKKLQDAGVYVEEIHSTKFIDNHCYHFNFWTKTSKDTLKFTFNFLDRVKNREL